MLTIAALAPAVVLMMYIYKKDKVEKEPIGLLLKILVLGMFSVLPILICEILFGDILELFVKEGTGLYILLENFIVIALVEEYWKRWCVKMAAWNHPDFNYRFDAVVYCVFSALGFAAVENLLYVSENGLLTAVLRAFTAVPSHAIDGVIMGFFLGEAKIREMREDYDGMKKFHRMSLFMPVLSHGLYDYSLSVDHDYAIVFFLLFVVMTTILTIRYIRKASREDERI